ncbi:Amidophosphoribosyltransferase precursor [compost metagenome]
MRKEINADSLSFLSPEGLIQSIGGGNAGDYKGGLCLSCFDNDYPTQVDFGGQEKEGCGC